MTDKNSRRDEPADPTERFFTDEPSAEENLQAQGAHRIVTPGLGIADEQPRVREEDALTPADRGEEPPPPADETGGGKKSRKAAKKSTSRTSGSQSSAKQSTARKSAKKQAGATKAKSTKSAKSKKS